MRTPQHDHQDKQPPSLAKVNFEACAHFRPDAINRVAGMGLCGIFNGWNYPGTERRCREFKVVADA